MGHGACGMGAPVACWRRDGERAPRPRATASQSPTAHRPPPYTRVGSGAPCALHQRPVMRLNRVYAVRYATLKYVVYGYIYIVHTSLTSRSTAHTIHWPPHKYMFTQHLNSSRLKSNRTRLIYLMISWGRYAGRGKEEAPAGQSPLGRLPAAQWPARSGLNQSGSPSASSSSPAAPTRP